MKKIVYLALNGLLMTTSIMAQKAKSPATAFPAFDTEAHRGGRGLQPENTIPAMLNALKLGVTTLEMDTHITADGKVVLSHDDALNPLFALTPEGKAIPKEDAHRYAIYKMPYADIARFDVGSKPYDKFPDQQKIKAHIPLLTDVIDSVQQYLKANKRPQVFYNIETKSNPKNDNIYNPEPEQFVDVLMAVIENKKVTPYVIIQSFDKRTLQVLHQKYPQVKTSYLVDKGTLADNIKELGFTPNIYSPTYKLVNAELVKDCHNQGLKIIPWTVNTPEEIDALKQTGVDGIISDYPNLLIKQSY